MTSVALVATVTQLSFLAAGGSSVVAQSQGQASTVTAPVVPGAGAAYVGAFVDPSGTTLSASDPTGGTASVGAELGSLPEFDQLTHHAPSILSTFENWDQSADAAGLESVAATGAIPMVTWNCGDSDANVAAGIDDATVTAEAQALAGTDVPILLRWFPDPNLTGAPATAACLGSAGASGYVAAYQHIRDLFAAAGARNVAFVWSVATSSAADQQFANYYPGGDSVDWVGADGDAASGYESQPPAFSSQFGAWYSALSTAGKPMMVSSTGTDGAAQPAYLGQVLSDLPSAYPLIKAVVYFDGPDMVSGDQDQLGVAGLASLGYLMASPYFNPTRAGTVTTVSSSQVSVEAGATVTLSASVNAGDNSGSLSFLDNGAVVAGCLLLPFRASPSCTTPGLSAGVQTIVALYSGDSAFAPSTSAPITVTVLGEGHSSASSSPTGEPTSTSTTTTAPVGATASGTLGGPAPTSGPVSVPAAGSTYLGAFVDPSGSSLRSGNPTGGISSLSSELAALPAVEQTVGRPLSIVPVYLNWRDTITVTELDQVIATGAIPMVTWNCGDTDARVFHGRDDARIDEVAAVLAHFQFPVFLRWFPDPNVKTTASDACLGGGAAGYVAAYQHLHQKVVADGATNVAFVWSVDTTTPQASGSWRSFYPGAQYVNWIGADGYATTSTTANVSNDFGTWYATFSADKPLMIAQTAAIPGLQAQYIDQLSTVPTRYPGIRAVVYFDAPDLTAGQSYELAPQSPGEQRLDAMSDLPGFQPTTSATTTTGTASSDNASPGQVVHLSAQVGNGDEGGSLSFDDNGSAITGCGTVPLFLAANCDTSSLSVGDNEIVVHYSGDARSGASASSAIDVVIQSGPPAVGPPTIPGSGQVYLGAWVRPQVTHTAVAPRAAVSQELEDLPSFNGGLARPLSVVHVYQPWSYPASTRQVVDILADGAIPMIDWYCGDTDANVIAGNDDALITAEARELAAFKAPVFLRWYWEPNFPRSADYADCIGSLGPAGYAAAFRHIHDLFAAAGASNVAFVFSMSTSGPDHDLYAYYPGSNYVDWIAADGYLRTAAPPATGFSDQFGSWYSDFADFGKPMMISETATFAGGQSSYLQQVESQLAPGGAFPLVKAIMYFDAPGDEGLYTYPLDSAGMTQFASLAADPLFQPARSASTVAATASPASSSAGQRVVIDAQVSNTDYGGSTSFFVNGAPLTGCQSVPVGSTSSCKTTSLPVGSDQIVAVYSGDAEVQGSAATTVTNVVTRPAVTAPPGSGSSSDSGSVPAPSTPQFGFLPFLALPDIGGVASLGFPDGGRAPFAFTITPTLPNAATTSPGGGSDLDPITWTTNLLHGRDGAASVLVPTGGVILFLLAAYMVTTWAQDRKRSKRAVHAPAGDDAVDLELGPIDAGGGVTPP